MKKIICFLLIAVVCLGAVACGANETPDDTQNYDKNTSDTEPMEDFDPDDVITAMCSYDDDKYDLTTLIKSGKDFKVTKNGKALDGMNVPLTMGVNVFHVTYNLGSLERKCEVRIARREGYRVVFNSNGGSFIDTQYVADYGSIDDATVIPTRDRYNFLGWYDEQGNKVTLAATPIIKDTTFTARWEGPTSNITKTYDPIEYTTSSAALNIVWKDYDNAFKYRPSEIFCELKNTTTNVTYSVKLTKTSAEFVGASPMGASIARGAGNWTVKITGLTDQYTLIANNVDGEKYTLTQSGTSVTYTVENYDLALDDTTWLMTENGRLYDLAGNLTILKGVVTPNVGWGTLPTTTTVHALTRLQKEGVNCIRVTVMTGGSNGYWSGTSTPQTEKKKAELLAALKQTIDNASSIGMYCIVDWGVSMGNVATGTHAQYMNDMLPHAVELFSAIAKEYKDDPYVMYEICNEPAVPGSDGWATHVRGFEDAVIRAIRNEGCQGLVIAGPNMYARNISEYNSNDDPIAYPFATDISYNVAYTFHSYPAQFPYDYEYRNGERYNYGWRLSDAIKAGLTIVTTEFNPGLATKFPIGDTGGTSWDIKESDKFLNVMLENDVSYMFFRYTSGYASETATSAQEMFIPGNIEALSKGTWTVDMMNVTGKWFYDNALNSTGFIKVADFSYHGIASKPKS